MRLRSVQEPRGVLKELHLGHWERGKEGNREGPREVTDRGGEKILGLRGNGRGSM